MNAAGSAPDGLVYTKPGYPSWRRSAYDLLVTADRPGIAASAGRLVKRAATVRRDVVGQGLLICKPRLRGRHVAKIRSDGDQMLKPVVGIFLQIHHNDLTGLRYG